MGFRSDVAPGTRGSSEHTVRHRSSRGGWGLLQLTRSAASPCLLVVTRLAIALTHSPGLPRGVPGLGVCEPTCGSPSLLPA
jgi:hypothetical protein